jgi:hypothetical protein
MGWAILLLIRGRLEDTHRLELSTEQKLQLVHKVAFNLFYLFSALWVRESWTSEDVYITWQKSSVGLIYPVFSRNPSIASVNVSGTEESSQPKITFINSLGRFLVEIWCGTTWSHLRRTFLAGDGLSRAAEPDTSIFNRLVDWVNDSKIADRDKPFHLEGSSYFMAVRKCFTCDFNLGQRDENPAPGNKDFARWIYRHVLLPLQYALEDFQIQQDRFFGTRLDFCPQISAPPMAEDAKRLRLFTNEDIKGNRTEN